MNKFCITTPLDKQLQPDGLTAVEMTLTAVANQPGAFGEVFRAAFEVEILRGFWFSHDDGSTTYCFECDNEKATQLKQALTLAFFSPESN
ncbi:hypothetical protein [Hymenobacter swuensis]|uniref:Uncharacterized protein n=1 Tax=Hymenobacter swuensis DY53 TaxID=1227739 RepID=W8F4M6_9BACT|nr:hypothetical protein [Hymenobacter swuensis]AHJ98957.1 hypothetical protein Hsw_3362 [Hymenobacter swuensis DY53]